MTLDTQTPQITTSSLEISQQKQKFNWRHCWYPVCFARDLPANRPYSFSLYDEPFVLFKHKDGQIVCLTDRCPHRAARLSDGQIINGRIECLYHGWQFGVDGQCLHIPQLPEDAKIPVKACVSSFQVVERQGIIWVWADVGEAGGVDLIPTIAELDDESELFCADYIRDLPYDQTYFIENVIDPAHVYISHDGVLGKREDAQPLEMEVTSSSLEGIRGRWRLTQQPNARWSSLDFIAPNLVIYQFGSKQAGKYGGTALYSIPLGRQRCRILLRNYGNFFPKKMTLMPPWLDHIMARNKILEGDLQLVVEQKAQIERLGQNLQEVYLPLKTSDTLVVEYRKWLDKFGASFPFYQGYSSAKNVGRSEQNENLNPLDRWEQHTLICSSCNRAYLFTNRLKQILVGVAIATLGVAVLADDSPLKVAAVLASLVAIATSIVAQKVKIQFEQSYTRPTQEKHRTLSH
ncbi:Rieske 2Fe-2S domain-containing protein [Chroococcidiopsis sp. SAG 2025]|uniref:aromatic ring-hydroxylating dioxygenase subunit alpha n=1 Tax=Chroococcidiopsis sp. SAG 2025 TaxID=171389 RepID=UPI00293721E0|nr:Rieske 2Fe-2S domain-containing protein [Chroococcidiopsis sp. SAG 2025]